MSNDKEQMQVEFHNRANEMLFSIYHAFESSIANVSRRSAEFKFQQLKKQYATTLEQELHAIARGILVRHKDERQLKELDPMFHHFIQEYLHRFIQKVNDL
jgi:hypothetical protein